MSIKALSLRQPYAELIVQGIKTIELRKWNTKFRGKFLVHASKFQPNDVLVWELGLSLHDLEFGALIGVADLIDVKDYDKLPASEWEMDAPKHLAGIDYMTSTKGFILKNAKKFRYSIPCKGQLNFFNVDDEAANSFRVKMF